MSEPGDRLDRAYRSLAREEPPASLDAEILAAARRAVARPSLARRWGVPVSMAALLVLAIGVTLEMQYEEPGIETSAPKAPASVPAGNSPQPESKPALSVPLKPAEKKAKKREAPATQEAPAIREAPQAFPAAPAPVQSQGNLVQQAPRAQSAPLPQQESRAAAAPPATASVPMPAAPPAAAEERFAAPAPSMAKRSVASGGAAADLMTATTNPATELERIAKLREAGRDAEADRALEDFRKRFPGYHIDDAMWQRVKPRTSEERASPR